MKTQETLRIDVFGHSDKQICAGCEGHGCGSCTPGEKKATRVLFDEFVGLLETSDLRNAYTACFYEATPENIARNDDVQRILSMAELDPVICINGKIAYMGGFSPEGLLSEIRKRQ